MKRCRHPSGYFVGATVYAPHLTDSAIGSCGPGWTTVPGRLACTACGHWLPLGPARDDERTAVEVRAARLAQINSECAPVVTALTHSEHAGWMAHLCGTTPMGDGWWAGWLAREIATNEEG